MKTMTNLEAIYDRRKECKQQILEMLDDNNVYYEIHQYYYYDQWNDRCEYFYPKKEYLEILDNSDEKNIFDITIDFNTQGVKDIYYYIHKELDNLRKRGDE